MNITVRVLYTSSNYVSWKKGCMESFLSWQRKAGEGWIRTRISVNGMQTLLKQHRCAS